MTDQLLSDATARYIRMADARAFWDTRLASAVAGLAGDPEPLVQLHGWLDAGRRAALDAARTKAAVTPSTIGTDGTSLASPPAWAAAFLDLAKVDSAIDLLGAVGQPLNTVGASLDSFGAFTWVGEGLPAPVVAGVTASATVLPFKFGGIVVTSRELALHSSPAVRAVVQRAALRELQLAGNRLAIDPTLDAVADTSPASLTFGATEVGPSANAEGIESDARDLLMTISDGEPERPRFILSRRAAAYLSASRHSTAGVKVFAGLEGPTPTILGTPCVIASGVPDYLVCVDAAAVALADGGIDISVSSAADLQMDADPSAGAQSALLSLFQTGLIAIKVMRWINWRCRAGAIAYRSLPLSGSPLL